MPGSTTRLGLYLPGGGSSGVYDPDEVADIDKLNENFVKLDAAIGVSHVTSTTRPAAPMDGQIIRESDTQQTLVYRQGTSQWENLDSVDSGTAALRDLVYPTPSTPAGRIALANRHPRWYNTEKGYEQQYFAQFDDAGIPATTPCRKVFGWRATGARVPISVFTVGGGTPANVKKYGNQIEVLSGGSNSITVDGCFTADFDQYEILFELFTLASGSNFVLQLRKAGVTTLGTGYTSQRVASIGGAVTSIQQPSSTQWDIAGPSTTDGQLTQVILTNPASVDWKRMFFHGGAPGINTFDGTGILKDITSHDGFLLGNASAITRATVRIYGLNSGL